MRACGGGSFVVWSARFAAGLLVAAGAAGGAGCGGGGSGGGGGGAGSGSLMRARSYLADYDFGDRTKKGLEELGACVGGPEEAGARTLRALVTTDVMLYAEARKDEKLLGVVGGDRAAALKSAREDADSAGESGAALARLLKALEARGKGPAFAAELRAVADGKDKDAATRARIVGIEVCLDGYDAAMAAPPEGVEPALAVCGAYVKGTPRPWGGAIDRVREDFRWLSDNARTGAVTDLWSKLEERLGALRKEHEARFPRAVTLEGLDLPPTAAVDVADVRTPFARVTPTKVYVGDAEIADTGGEGLYAKAVDPVLAAAGPPPPTGTLPPLTIYADKSATYYVVADLMLAAQTAGLDGVVLAGAGPDAAALPRGVHVGFPPPKGVDAPKAITAVLTEKGLTVAGKGGGTVALGAGGKVDWAKAKEKLAAVAAAEKAGALVIELKPKVPAGDLVALADAAAAAAGPDGKPILGAVIVDPMAGRAVGPAALHPTGPTPSDLDSKGSIDAKAVKRLIGARLGAIKSCYEKELKRDHDIAGRIAVRVVVNTDGTVRFANVELDTIKNARIRGCLTTMIAKIVFPKPDGGRATFIYPFDLTPTGS
jgi:biopolymer transport protein ExbD